MPVQDVDVLISLGDLPNSVILEVADLCCPKEILAVRGNHDTAVPFPEGVRDMHCVVHEIEGVRFGGFNGSWRYKNRGHFLYEQEEATRLMAGFPAVDIFISHNSPKNCHERDTEIHVGFEAFNGYIGRAKPGLFLHGHQHLDIESLVGSTRVIGTFGHRLLELPDVG